jgi:hypothetical protein
MKLSKKLTLTLTIGLLLILPMLATIGNASSATITPLADVLDGTARDVYVDGTTAYVSAGAGGLKIYDISTLTAPELIGESGDIGYVESVFISDNYAYVAAGEEGIVTLDITDPTNPMFVDSYRSHGTEEHATEILFDSGIAYLADGEDGFETLAISPTGDIFPRDHYDAIGTAYDALELVGNRVYAVGRYGMKVFDVTSPYVITPTANYNEGGWPSDIDIQGNYAYIADLEEGLEIVNITMLSNMSEVGQYDAPFRSLSSVTVEGDYAYVTSFNGFEIINVTDVTNPVKVGGFDNGRGLGIDIVGSYAFVCEFERGVGIYDITDVTNPTEYARIDEFTVIEDISVSGDAVYVAAGEEGAMKVDISTLSSPILMGTYNDAPIYTVEAHSGYLYGVSDSDIKIISETTMDEVANWAGDYFDVIPYGTRAYLFKIDGIDILDITNPEAPTYLGNYTHNTYGGLTTGYIDDTYVYAVNPDYGVYILDAQDATDVQVVGLMVFDFVDHLSVQGETAYLISENLGLGIFDISDPTTPTEITRLTAVLETPYGGLARTGNAVVIGNLKGISVYDVYDRKTPVKIAQFNENRALIIKISGNVLLYTTGEGGLDIANINVSLDSDKKIAGYSPVILVGLLFGISVLIAFRKFKK